MNKKVIILSVLLVIIIICLTFFLISKRENNTDIINVSIRDTDGNLIRSIPVEKKLVENIENANIEGIVELNHGGHIYIFNGQHFGEYGFEIKEYTSANIDNKNQECIDYFTSDKYDTSYIQEGDILICSGDLKKYSIGNNDFDTKKNSIIVLKSQNYNEIKKETLRNERKSTATVGEYFDSTGEIYIKYDVRDREYSLPFVLKFNIIDNVKIIGNLEDGKKVKIQYKNLDVPLEEVEIDTIEVVE